MTVQTGVERNPLDISQRTVTPTGGNTGRTQADWLALTVRPETWGASPSATSAVNTAAFLTAIAKIKLAGGGRILVSAGTYALNATLAFDFNYWVLEGDSETSTYLDFDDQTSGPGIAVGGCFFWEINRIGVKNAFTDNIEVGAGTVTGPQTYPAQFAITNVYTRGAGRDGIRFGASYQMRLRSILAQLNTAKGINFLGFHTTIDAALLYALTNSDDGISVRNAIECSFVNCAGDFNTGHAVRIEDLSGVVFPVFYGESNTKALIGAYYEAAHTITSGFKGFRGVKFDAPYTQSNDTAATNKGYLLHAEVAAADDAFTSRGEIEIIRPREAGTLSTYSCWVEKGHFNFVMPRGNYLSKGFGQLSYSTVSDGAADEPYANAVNITGAGIKIGTLRPRELRARGSFGGLITIYVTQNTGDSTSSSAIYQYLMSKNAGVNELVPVAEAGMTAGASSAEAAFTFSLGTVTASGVELLASPTGAATSFWFFHVSVVGPMEFLPV